MGLRHLGLLALAFAACAPDGYRWQPSTYVQYGKGSSRDSGGGSGEADAYGGGVEFALVPIERAIYYTPSGETQAWRISQGTKPPASVTIDNREGPEEDPVADELARVHADPLGTSIVIGGLVLLLVALGLFAPRLIRAMKGGNGKTPA